ncbi:MAG: serine--glyoxylate aminotransferase, partial [Desulfofustis sp.]|nr:serine--glyoxylate aminotransferase [Desulfofustis sp.]
MNTYHAGRHFLQIPGPSNVPDRILHAIGHPTIDHRGPEFRKLSEEVLIGSRRIFKTSGPVLIFPTSGTGAWEAS